MLYFVIFERCRENGSWKFSPQKESIFLLWLCVMTNAEKKNNGEYEETQCLKSESGQRTQLSVKAEFRRNMMGGCSFYLLYIRLFSSFCLTQDDYSDMYVQHLYLGSFYRAAGIYIWPLSSLKAGLGINSVPLQEEAGSTSPSCSFLLTHQVSALFFMKNRSFFLFS